MQLKNTVAILTGAGNINGIGAATARLLAKQGVNLIINCSRNTQQAELITTECKKEGVEAELFVGDLTQAKICHAMATFVKEKWNRADIIVNCLGLTKSAAYERLDQLNEEDFARILAVNVTAPYLVAQAFQELLRTSGNGAIINISSAAGITGKGSSIAYAAAKGAENTLTLALAQALSPEVRVNAICPNFVDSSWWEETFKGREEKYNALIASTRDGNLLRRVLTPIDVAYTILSVIQNPMMTGELIRLDGGAHVGKANPREEAPNQ